MPGLLAVPGAVRALAGGQGWLVAAIAGATAVLVGLVVVRRAALHLLGATLWDFSERVRWL
ncbi:MAG: hypothetical protein ACXVGH_03385 [Mycobacteriales bacterium]